MRTRTGLRNLDAALSLMDRHVNILGMEGSRMDWEDLMEWQRVILGGDPTAEEAPPPAKPPFRVAGLPDPQHGGGPIWGAPRDEPPLRAVFRHGPLERIK